MVALIWKYFFTATHTDWIHTSQEHYEEDEPMESTDYDVMQWWGLNLDPQGNRRKPKTGTLLYDVLNLFASTFMSRKISLESGHPPRKTPNTQTNQPTKTKTKNMLAHLIPKKTHIPIKQKAFSLKKSCNVLFGKHQVLLIQQHNYTDASRLTYGKASLSKSLMFSVQQ